MFVIYYVCPVLSQDGGHFSGSYFLVVYRPYANMAAAN